MKWKSILKIVPLAIVALFLLNGCYYHDRVQESQVGLQLKDGSKIKGIVHAGQYTSWAMYDDMKVIDLSAKKVDWEDPDLVTKDPQKIGIALAVEYARGSSDDDIKQMWTNYHAEAIDDEALQLRVLARVPDAVKTVTPRYSTVELIGTDGSNDFGRGVIKQDVSMILEKEFAEFGVRLINVAVTNISPPDDWINLIDQKANVKIEQEIATQKTQQLQEQLKQEQAQTAIELEKANRDKQTEQVRNQAFTTSPEALELEKYRLLADALRQCTSFCNFPDVSPQPVVPVPAPTPKP